ncbi:ABC transporter permease [Hymenobacter terrenus]|uniref:ABC transporter permease n=1 Tax=Hymenobacter terrenus TaxID=1629124 RepID=UPI0006197DD8|nr:ABC transporter permease [Hymenobacter terrenus]
MIRHLFTLIWNRRRANFLLVTEIFLAFVVLFVVGSLLVYNQQNYQNPLGFEYEQVWRVGLDPGTQPKAERLSTLRQIIQRLRGLSGVQALGLTYSNTPFTDNHNTGDVNAVKGGHKVEVNSYWMEDDIRDVLSLRVLAGRWFDKRDDASNVPPVILTQDAQEQLFPQQSALGRIVYKGKKEFRVVGVVENFRGDGDLSSPKPAILRRLTAQDTSYVGFFTLLVRVRPGTGAELERQMTIESLAIGKGWSVGITPLPEQRAAQLKRVLTPIVAMVLSCVFLVVNVALGLFGVLWQTINQRRSEIGLRRAMGASAGAISGQVVGEILVVTTFGLMLGLGVAAQFPLLGVLGVSVGVYLTAMVLATGLIYALTAICALYPSRLAAGIHPAVALREE